MRVVYVAFHVYHDSTSRTECLVQASEPVTRWCDRCGAEEVFCSTQYFEFFICKFFVPVQLRRMKCLVQAHELVT